MMEHISWTKVLMVNFPKIPYAYLSKNYAFLYSVILLYYDGVHEVDKINTSQLKFLLGEMGNVSPIWPKIVTPYVSWSALL